MVMIYATLIKKGFKKIEDVPKKLRPAVHDMLNH